MKSDESEKYNLGTTLRLVGLAAIIWGSSTQNPWILGTGGAAYFAGESITNTTNKKVLKDLSDLERDVYNI